MSDNFVKVVYVQQRYEFDPDRTDEEEAAVTEACKERNGYLHAWFADMEDGYAKPFALVEDEEDGKIYRATEDALRVVRS